MSIATPDVGATNESGVFDAAETFLKRIEGAEKPPKAVKEEIEETEREETEETEVEDAEELSETDEDDGEPDDTKDDEETEDDDKDEKTSKAKKDVSDDVIVKVKVNGQEHDVSVADLKRLYGQEKSLTHKSQEVATQRKKLEEVEAKQVTALTTMFQRAQARAKPYAELDFLALTKDPNFSAEDLTNLRTEAEKAFADVNFYGQELDNTYRGAMVNRQEQLKREATEAHKVLNDPKTGIAGWSQSMYDEIRHFSISNGLNAEVVNNLTDPFAIKMLHMAMQFDKGQKALSKTSKVVKTGKKIIKSSSSDATKEAKPDKQEAAMKALKRSGTVDDATSAFLSRMLG